LSSRGWEMPRVYDPPASIFLTLSSSIKVSGISPSCSRSGLTSLESTLWACFMAVLLVLLDYITNAA
jgi:hypothetical protein